MARIRRVGLAGAATTVVIVIGAAYVAEGIGLAVIAATGLLVVAAIVIPVIAVFEEQRKLPFEEAARRRW